MSEQLMISDRMASMGVLAAGVAHEINNPLAAVLGNLDFALQGFDDLGLGAEPGPAPATQAGGQAAVAPRPTLTAEGLAELIKPLREAREAAERVKNIVRDLKVFSRSDDEEEPGPVDLRPVIDSALRMASNEIRHRAELVKDYGEVRPVLATEGRLVQVFLNLIVNAAQAMPAGRADSNVLRVVTRMDRSGWALVEVQDTGPGIPPDIITKIFDPFVTTKSAGVGTGLGLAICRRIVITLGGEISVESEVGRGTVFKTRLPACQMAAPTIATPAPPVRAVAKRGRILAVDDEPMLVSVLQRIVGGRHEFKAVNSARDALALIMAGERFDVILCDMMMPGMTGMDLHIELAKIDSDLPRRMIFVTGGVFTGEAQQFLDRTKNPLIAKPFDAKSLLALVQGFID